MEDIKEAIKIYKEGRYNLISKDLMEVDSHSVKRQVKQGRTLLICSCTSHTKFCNENPICRHKYFFLIYPLIESMDGKLSELINYYSTARTICKTEEGKKICLQAVDDLKRVRGI